VISLQVGNSSTSRVADLLRTNALPLEDIFAAPLSQSEVLKAAV
jgi:hypothetical protein